jgi:hypothetical protein
LAILIPNNNNNNKSHLETLRPPFCLPYSERNNDSRDCNPITLQRRLMSLATLVIQYNRSIVPLMVRRESVLPLSMLATLSDHDNRFELGTLRRKAWRVADCKSRACAGLQIEVACVKVFHEVLGIASEGRV